MMSLCLYVVQMAYLLENVGHYYCYYYIKVNLNLEVE